MTKETRDYIEKWKKAVMSKGYEILCVRKTADNRFIATLRAPWCQIIRKVPIRRLVVNM